MKIISTSDVDLNGLRRFSEQLRLGANFEAQVDSSQVFLRSADPPSWVALLAEASWWSKILGASAALFVAELIKEAAKDTWRNRGKVSVAAKYSGTQLRKLAEAIAAWRNQVSSITTLGIGVPVPNEFFSTKLALDGTEASDLAVQIALFVHHLPELERVIAEHGLAEGNAATGVFLQLRDDGSLSVTWHDRHTLQVREHTLELK